MRNVLEHLFDHGTLAADETRLLMNDIVGGLYNNSQIAAVLAVLRLRGVTVAELSGFRQAMLDLCLKVELAEFDPIDIVGTGGDGKNTFNISTLACFVVAGCGIRVAKHGNYGASSVSGASDVLEHLGVRFEKDEQGLRRQIARSGLCFMHAPFFHPAMKIVAPVRKELGVRTVCNLLGPIANPARPRRQLLGVNNLELLDLYGRLFAKEGPSFCIVHSLDGYDEFSLTGPAKVIFGGKEEQLSPEELGFKRVAPEELYAGDSKEMAARIFLEVLENRSSAAKVDVVVANAGLALRCAKPDLSLKECFEISRNSLLSGKAREVLSKLVA
jgi:anthranilate phosphoribosyltransferase